MARRTEQRTVGGFPFTVNQFEPRAALRLAPKVWRAMHPLIPLIGKQKGEIPRSAMLPLADAFFERLLEVGGDELVPQLLAGSTITMPLENEDGSPGQLVVHDLGKKEFFDLAFTGRLDLMMQCAFVAVEVNFFRYFFAKGSPAPTAAPGPGATANQ